MNPETALTNRIRRYLESKGYLTVKYHGGPYSQVGFPDLIVIGKGKVGFIEVKTFSGHVSEIQKHWIKKLKAQGCPSGVARLPEEALKIMEEKK